VWTRKLNDVEESIREVKSDIKNTQNQLSNRKAELDEKTSINLDDVDKLRAEKESVLDKINELQKRKSDLERKKQTIKPLRTFITQITNDSISANEIASVLSEFSDEYNVGADDTDVLSGLLASSSNPDTVCVVCGNNTDTDHYEQIDLLSKNVFQSINRELSQIDGEISDMMSQKGDIETKIGDVIDTQNRIDELQTEISKHTDEVDRLTSELEDLQAESDQLNAQLDNLEDETDDEAVQEFIRLNRDQSELIGEIKAVEGSIDRLKTEYKNKKEDIEQADVSTERIDEIETEIKSLRNKEERIENEFISKFNEEMDTVLSELEYEGVERIWIERKQKTVKEGRRNVEKQVFNLNIVREINGVATQDSIENLSESEREVTSLILAITGYKIHNVQDVFPIALVDSVEMVDAQRLEQLLNYLSDYPDYLIVAALSEDVDAMDIEDNITEMSSAMSA